MRFALVAFVCIGLLPGAPQPFVRASIDSPRPIIAGQAVRLNVTVLVPNYFTGAPDFPQIDIDNAIIVAPSETPQHSVETIGAQSFAGITVTYSIYPQQPGTFRLPPAKIAVKYAANPPQSIELNLPLPSISFEATIPAAAADFDYFLPTASLLLTQKLDKPLTGLKVGDTFTRTIAISAARLRAMLIPPIKYDAPQGVAVYPTQPIVDDVRTDRNEFVGGKRIDAATYLIRKEGTYELPAIRIQWWNIKTRKVQTATLPPLSFSAAPNQGYHTDLPPEPEPVASPDSEKHGFLKTYRHAIAFAVRCLLSFGLIVYIWLRFRPSVLRRWREFRREQKNSESAFFHKLRRACRSGDTQAAYVYLQAWLRCFSPNTGLSDFVSYTSDAGIAREVELLTASLFGRRKPGEWSGTKMIDSLAKVRNREHVGLSRPVALPPLNP